MSDKPQPLLLKLPPGTYRVCGCGTHGGGMLCAAECARPEASAPFTLKRRLTRAWLCRCGTSRTLPHCDGSHNTLGDH